MRAEFYYNSKLVTDASENYRITRCYSKRFQNESRAELENGNIRMNINFSGITGDAQIAFHNRILNSFDDSVPF